MTTIVIYVCVYKSKPPRDAVDFLIELEMYGITRRTKWVSDECVMIASGGALLVCLFIRIYAGITRGES